MAHLTRRVQEGFTSPEPEVRPIRSYDEYRLTVHQSHSHVMIHITCISLLTQLHTTMPWLSTYTKLCRSFQRRNIEGGMSGSGQDWLSLSIQPPNIRGQGIQPPTVRGTQYASAFNSSQKQIRKGLHCCRATKDFYSTLLHSWQLCWADHHAWWEQSKCRERICTKSSIASSHSSKIYIDKKAVHT